MKVILTRDVPKLGRRGEVIEVADGYGRNYLLPRGLALPADEGLVQEAAERERARRAKEERQAEKARREATRLEGREIAIRARVGEGGKLFGAVTNKEIAETLAREFQVEIDKRKVDLEAPIKAPGVYPVMVRLHPQVSVTVNVRVEGVRE
ncbi:MAG: 50S ribosomal protein L9 [Moorellales bacterium]